MASLGDLFVRVGANLDGFRAAMGEVKTTVGGMGGVFQKFGSTASIGLGVMGAGALAVAVKFDDAFATISNATGKTGKDLDNLKSSFKAVYGQVDESSAQVSEALSLLATRTGLTGTKLETLTVKLLDLAKVQGEQVGSLTPALTRVWGDWSIATEKQAGSMDFLGTVSQQTGTKVSRLSELVVSAGAPLRSLGFDFENATALIAKFDAEGVNTELVLGGMKKALATWSKEGKDAGAEWAKLVAGVTKGSITMQDVMKLVGVKVGTDLFKAIQENRFKIDETVESFKALSKEGLKTTDTLTEQFKTYAHQLELVIGQHSTLITTIGLAAPAIISLGNVAKGAFGAIGLAVGAVTTGVALMIAGLSLGLGKLADYELAKSNATSPGLKLLNQKYGPQSTGSIMDAALAFTQFAEPVTGAPTATTATTKGSGVAAGKSFSVESSLAFDAISDAQGRAKKTLEDYFTAARGGFPVALNLTDAQASATRFTAEATLDLQDSLRNTTPVLAQMAEVDFNKSIGGILKMDAIMAQFGLTSTHALRSAYEGALAAGNELVRMGAPAADVNAQMGKAAELHRNWSQQVTGWTVATKTATSVGSVFGRQMSTIYSDLGKSLADVILGTKSLGDAFRDVGKAGLRMITEDLIGIGFNALKSGLKGLMKDIGGLGSALSGVFGGGASAAGSIAGSAGGAGASVAGSAGTVASTGLASVMGMVTGAVSAVSGVIGNFQFAGMNKSLDVIVNHTLRTFNEVFQQRIDHWEQFNQTFTRLGEIWNTLKGGAGGVSIDLRNSTFGAGVNQQSIEAMFQAAFLKAQAARG